MRNWKPKEGNIYERDYVIERIEARIAHGVDDLEEKNQYKEMIAAKGSKLVFISRSPGWGCSIMNHRCWEAVA